MNKLTANIRTEYWVGWMSSTSQSVIIDSKIFGKKNIIHTFTFEKTIEISFISSMSKMRQRHDTKFTNGKVFHKKQYKYDIEKGKLI